MKNYFITIFLALVAMTGWAQNDLKPRLVVCTDIAPADVEPDDMESMATPSASFGGNSRRLAERR